MYCKNCGRELKEGTRFCDRCGQSVRQSNKSERAARREEIEALKEERLNRKKRMAALEAEKAARKNKKKSIRKSSKRKSHKLIYVIAIILIIFVTSIISYIATRKDSENADWKTKDESIELNATPTSTQQPVSGAVDPSPSVLPTVAAEIENTDPINNDGYRVFSVSDNLDCPYPSVFIKKSTSGNVLLSIMDTTGGATMTITQEKYSSSTKASELMKEYAQSAGGTIIYSLAGNNWYGITTTKDNMIYHRKCLLLDGKLTYYDFQYDQNSVSASQYESYIEYIDNAFII